MGLHQGVLHKLSGGISDTARAASARFTHREFIEIGDTHIRNLRLRSYHDALLQDAIGEVVTLSVVGPPARRGGVKTVVGIRVPKLGVVRPSLIGLVFISIAATIMFWIAAVGWLLIGALVGFLVSIFSDTAAFVVIGLAIAAAVVWVFLPFFYAVRLFRAWAAIKRASAVEGQAALTS